jgi:hypothetical protein
MIAMRAAPGPMAVEDWYKPSSPNLRSGIETAGAAVADRGARLPVKQGSLPRT